MSNNNFIKNITSKDINLSHKTILNMIKSASSEDFKELCQNCDFIFPFLKERINNDFVKLINKDDIKTTFEFAKIYCADFEDLIIKSWLKYASEDLTDEILELFESGTYEQKAYCAIYFKYIQDPLALEYLNKYSYYDFEPLKINCAQTLSTFNDTKTYNDMKNIILNSNDDFEKNSSYLFLSAFGGKDAIKFIIDNAFNSPFKINIISNLLTYNNFDLIRELEENKIIRIFSTIIEGYPEDINLDTIGYFRIKDFIELINSFGSQFAQNSLILAREKFREFHENDIYSFDLDKQSKFDLKNIFNLLNSLALNTNWMNGELKQYNTFQYELALAVIKELKLTNFAPILANDLEFSDESYIAKSCLVLQELDSANLIPLTILDKIQNENIKALVESIIIK